MCMSAPTAAFDRRGWTDSHCEARNPGWLQTRKPNVDYKFCIWLQLDSHEMKVHVTNLLYLHKVLHFPASSVQDVKTNRFIVCRSTHFALLTYVHTLAANDFVNKYGRTEHSFFSDNFLLLSEIQKKKSSHNSQYPLPVLNAEPRNTKQKCWPLESKVLPEPECR